MAGKTFLDELAILNSQNFLGGLSQMGQAIKESEQNKTLVQLWNEFQLKKEGLSTTGEQISQFNKEYDSKTDREGFITKGDPLSDKIKEDAQATINLFGYMQKQKALLGTYEPFIQAFSLLGEDGVRIAKSLTDELGNKIAMLEKEGQIPFMQMEYDKMAFDMKWDKKKFEAWVENENFKRESIKASDYIIDDPLFTDLPAGEQIAWSPKEKAAYSAKYNTIIENTMKKSGLSRTAVIAGMKLAYDYSGRSFKGYELEPRFYGGGSGSDSSKLDVISYLGTLQSWSENWQNMNPVLRRAVQKYMQSGVLPSKDEIEGIDPQTVKDLADIYKPDGKYQELYTAALGMGLIKNDFEDRLIEGTDKKMRMPSNALGIVRPYKSTGFMYDQYEWNPYELKKLQAQLNKQIQEITNQSNFNASQDATKWYMTEEEYNNLMQENKMPVGATFESPDTSLDAVRKRIFK